MRLFPHMLTVNILSARYKQHPAYKAWRKVMVFRGSYSFICLWTKIKNILEAKQLSVYPKPPINYICS